MEWFMCHRIHLLLGKEMLSIGFKRNYNTDLHYMQYALLIRRYPRLMVCEFTFEQLVKHHKSILDFLEIQTEGLKEKLEFMSEITPQDEN